MPHHEIGVIEDRGRLSIGDHATTIQNDDMRTQFVSQPHIVGADQQGALFESAQQIDQGAPPAWVESGRRFVQHQNFRLHAQDAGEGDFASFRRRSGDG